MANYATLKAAIAAAIKQNGNNEITGNLLQQQLLVMVNSLGVGYQYAGIATTATNPGTPDQNVFYLASTAGTYTNFNGLVLTDGEIAILKYNGAWSKDSTGAASLETVNQLGQKFLEETVHEVQDDEVAGYLTDKNKTILAKLLKSGAVEWLVDNAKTVQTDARLYSIEDLLAYVSTELPETETDIVKYITDKNGNIIATINKKAEFSFDGGGGFAGELTSDRKVKIDAVKVLTDKTNKILGWFDKTGSLHLPSAVIDKLTIGGQIYDNLTELLSFISLVANGIENHKFVTNRTVEIIKGLSGNVQTDGVNIETYPIISLQDDDAIDLQLPQSFQSNATESTQPPSYVRNQGGFASVIFPLLRSLNLKYNSTIKGKLTLSVCAEGQRIGLTPLFGMQDTFSGSLNSCGSVLKALIDKEDWECICHSMTSRYLSNSYLVNGLDSEFANSLLVGATYDGTDGLGYSTTTCYDSVTKKNYKVKQDFSGWDECPIHYAKPYLALSKDADSQVVINPSYSVKYQVKTWLDRCDEAGLKHARCLVGWGNSQSEWSILEEQKYIDTVIESSSERTNTVPFMVNPTRNRMIVTPSQNGITEHADYYNVYNRYDYERIKGYIDDCVTKKSWCILRGHAYELQYCNKYFDYFTDLYGADREYCGPLCYKDDNYPTEWIVPLKHDELLDMYGDNTHDYWNNPPSRLNISTWDEWYPCPGTTLAMFYDLMEYAISQGVTFSKTQDVLDTFGNILAIGFEAASATAVESRLPASSKVGFYCKIGADNSMKLIKQ